MFLAYKGLRKWTDHTPWTCVKFQIRSWWTDLKFLPKNVYLDWRLKCLMKKDPVGFKKKLDSLKELMRGE